MEPVQRTRSAASPQHQTPVPASASLSGFRSVLVVLQDYRDAAGAHTTRCVAQVDHVVVAPERVQLIRTDAGLVVDLPAEAVVQMVVDEQRMVLHP
jgi:hypothetical protein